MTVTEEIGKGSYSDSESNGSKMKGKEIGGKLFEVNASSGGGKNHSPAKNLRKRNVGSPAVEKRPRRK